MEPRSSRLRAECEQEAPQAEVPVVPGTGRLSAAGSAAVGGAPWPGSHRAYQGTLDVLTPKGFPSVGASLYEVGFGVAALELKPHPGPIQVGP